MHLRSGDQQAPRREGGMTDFSARAVVGAVGILFLTAALPLLLERGFSVSTRVVLAGGLGLALFAAAVFWPFFASAGLTSFAGSLGSQPVVWLLLFLLLWMYMAATTIILLRQRHQMADVIERDMIPFRAALERWVLPRRLTTEQIESIGTHLRKFAPFAVSFSILR